MLVYFSLSEYNLKSEERSEFASVGNSNFELKPFFPVKRLDKKTK
jgi:hypothetical protein